MEMLSRKTILEVMPKGDSVKALHNGSPGSPSIILTSMIKNESKIIGRMLDSAALVATHFCLVDTGSTDNTLEAIKEWTAKNNASLAVYSVPFIDFGTTRTQTLRAAVQWAQTLKLDLENTYLLLLDADMALEIRGFETIQLKDDNYRILQDQGGLSYFNTRLVRASKAQKYTGRTHEYIETQGSMTDLHTLRINDLGDGGCKADKFERDIRLLEKDLEENPKNSRAMYYLATAYEAVGRYADAIAMYSKRADFPNSWEEEAWMACYRRGIAREASGDNAGAEKDYAETWARRPWRAEPLAKLANLALKQGQHQKACAFAKAGTSIPYPNGDVLFIEKNCYNDEFHQILGIADFYTGSRYDGPRHCDHLILKNSSYSYNALQNMVWYMKPLSTSQKIDLGEMFKDAIPAGYKPCNPSILRHFDPLKGGFRYSLLLRTVNYSINGDGSYNYPGYVHTRSLLCELDQNMKRVSVRELENPPSAPNSRIQGIEDVRIYQDRLLDENTYGVGTRHDGSEDRPQIYVCAWKESKLIFCNLLSEPGRTEKNWLPIMNQHAERPQTGSSPCILYSTGPELTLRDGGRGVYYKDQIPMNTHDFRGSSNVIPYLGGWLWIIHQVAVLPNETKRKYLHRLCWSRGNQDGPTIDGFRTSFPFCFDKAQIEFCSGACVAADGSLLITYGIEDNYAFLAAVDEKVVASMLGI